MKLKTLEEIDKDFLEQKGYSILCKPTRDLIKKELAIKWIKELEIGTHILFTNLTKRSCDDCASLLKHIFSVTKEDLK